MATTQTSGGVKKIRNGKRATVQDAGIAAARLRRGGPAPAPTETTRPPSMIPAVPAVAPNKSEDRMRIDALERENAKLRADIALIRGTIEYLRIHSSWPAEWVVAHGGAVEPGPDDPVDDAAAETRATEEVPAAEETTPAETQTETPVEGDDAKEPEPSAG